MYSDNELNQGNLFAAHFASFPFLPRFMLMGGGTTIEREKDQEYQRKKNTGTRDHCRVVIGNVVMASAVGRRR
jgi:hypothetical protein